MSWFPQGVDLSRGGVYAIENIKNGKLYIGSTNHFRSRLAGHLRSLKNNNHHNRNLQQAWHNQGEKSFITLVLEIVDNPNDLLDREQYYLDFYPQHQKYNIMIYSNAPTEYIRQLQQNGKTCIPIVQLVKYTREIIQEFKSIKDAARQLGLSDTNIHRSMKNNGTAGGFSWQTREDYENEVEVIDPSSNLREFYQIDLIGNIVDVHTIKAHAAISVNLSKSGVLEALKKSGGFAGGYFWIYVNEWREGMKFEIDPGVKRAIYQLDLHTKEIVAEHESITNAAKNMGVKYGVIEGALRRKSKRACGYFWVAVEDFNNGYSIPKTPLFYKPIYQIDKDTNEVVARYESISDAARHVGISVGAVSAAVRKVNKTSCGYKWEFVPFDEI